MPEGAVYHSIIGSLLNRSDLMATRHLKHIRVSVISAIFCRGAGMVKHVDSGGGVRVNRYTSQKVVHYIKPLPPPPHWRTFDLCPFYDNSTPFSFVLLNSRKKECYVIDHFSGSIKLKGPKKK